MEVAGPDPVLPVHLPKLPVCEENGTKAILHSFKNRCRELKEFRFENDFVNTGTTFLTDANPTHEGCKFLIP